MIDEKAFREKWNSMSEEEQSEIATAKWPMAHLREYEDMEQVKPQLTQKEKRQEEELHRLCSRKKEISSGTNVTKHNNTIRIPALQSSQFLEIKILYLFGLYIVGLFVCQNFNFKLIPQTCAKSEFST